MSKTILTNAFSTYKAQCEATNIPIVMDEFVFALVPNQDPNAPINPDETLPDDNYIQGRFNVTQKGIINPDAVVYSIILGTEIGSWDFNWIGLVNSEQNIVGAISHTPVQTKVQIDRINNIAGDTLTRNIITPYTNASVLTEIAVAADVWQLDFNNRLTAIDERIRLENIDNYGPATFIQNAWHVATNNDAITIAPGTAYIAGLQCINQQSILVDLTAIMLPKTLYLETCFKGTINSEWQTHTEIVIADTHPSTHIENGVTYYCQPLALINAINDIEDLRPIDWRSNHLLTDADNDPHPQYTKKTEVNNYVSSTSTNNPGVIMLATQADINEGVDESKAVTPATLKPVIESANSYAQEKAAQEANTVKSQLIPVIDSVKNYAQEKATQEAERVKSEIYGGVPVETLDTIKEVADALTQTGDTVAALFRSLGEKLPTTLFDAFKTTMIDSLNGKLGREDIAADSSNLNGFNDYYSPRNLPTPNEIGTYTTDQVNARAKLEGNDSTVIYGSQGLQISNFSGVGGSGGNGETLSNPSDNWHHHITLNHANTDGYYFDIACDFHHDSMYFKRVSNGQNEGWSELYHTNNRPVRVLSGRINHGDTIPVPNGFSRSQCEYIVSLSDSSDQPWDVDEGGTYLQYRTRCYANGETGEVTALRDVTHHGTGIITTACIANYMVIATR
ncbi:phage tail protein [Photobacterium phosphoreum]|uniref:phage tail-collar fiber domain-containing protein n=1 Tax=Photobacterium phosphoreum TaxID=659 RepID=UPI001E503107|nr:phage tail protein [Photobacterium phosphoreum]MCD9521063.1 hypothetical protein [Photobacterium phosphoreum]